MKHDVPIYGFLSALNADIDENKCGTVMAKPVFLITNTPMTLIVGITLICQKEIQTT